MLLQDLIALLNIFIEHPTKDNLDEIVAFTDDPKNAVLLKESGHADIQKALNNAAGYKKSQPFDNDIVEFVVTSQSDDLSEIVPEIEKIRLQLEKSLPVEFIED